MAEENNDANTEENTGSSPDVQLEPVKTDEGLISTTEFVEVEKTEHGEDSTNTDTSDDAELNTSKTESKEKDFHEHPRFKELVAEKNSYKEQADKAQQVQDEFEAYKKSQTYVQEEDTAFQKVLALDSDELIESMTENPHEFFKAFAQQQRTEIEQSIMNQLGNYQKQNQTQILEERQLTTFENYFDENPEAKAMLESGEIKQFMADHPGHNAISAYQTINNDSIIATATEAAVKEALAKQNKQLKAAGNAGSFSNSTSQPSVSNRDPQLKNPEKHGGRLAVLTERWKKRSA